LRDGRAIRVEGALLDAATALATEAQRLDASPWRENEVGGGDRPLEAQVWARPLGNGVWRRGCLSIDGDVVLFSDAPGAPGVERPGGSPADAPASHRLEDDLLLSADVRQKARRSEVYARLLYLALANATYRHADGSVFQGGMRSTGDLISEVSGSGSYLDWAWSRPSGVIDEEVLADLAGLGWTRE
jgi:hypothetical protein